MKIKTNHHWRQFIYRYDVPQEVLKNQFDYLDEDESYKFFQYKKHWYHLSEFLGDTSIKPWHGVYNHSNSAGIIIKLSDNDEEYQIGTFIS